MNDGKLDQLLSFLEHDPMNISLLSDCANAALKEDKLETAVELFDQLGAIEPLEGNEANMAAIAAMRSGRLEKAQQIFDKLLQKNSNDTTLKFNLAWTASLLKENDKALEYLDEDVTQELPQAAMLALQLTHSKGEFELAAEMAQRYLEIHEEYPPLLAAISTLAMDIENEDLARTCAERAGDHPEALTTLAMLSLGDQDITNARSMFEKSLQTNNQSPRAWIGLGLSSLSMGNSVQAGQEIDQGAEIFQDHLGSWIAAGWAYFIAKDYSSARERFERAFMHDPNFAESHGSLAVIDVIDNNLESAKKRIAVAMKLDRQCFSASYAQMLIEQSVGNDEKAQRILNLSLNQPINDNGYTIAKAIARLAGTKG